LKIIEFLQRCAEGGAFLSLRDGRLHYVVSGDGLPQDLRAEIVERKQEIIDFLLETSSYEETSPDYTIEAKVRHTSIRQPSAAQMRIWMACQLSESGTEYSMQGVFNVKGHFKMDVATSVLGEILSRHEPLRTRFTVRNGHPIAEVGQDVNIAIDVHDVAGLTGNEQIAHVKRIISDDASLPFDLEVDLLLRASYVILGESEGIFVLSTHHIACDGHSIDLLLKEFIKLYSLVRSASHVSALESLAITYYDFADWQSASMDARPNSTGLLELVASLDGARTSISLPQNTTPLLEGQRATGQIGRRLSDDVSHKLSILAASSNATLIVLFHAIYSVILARYSGGDDVVVGLPFDGRPTRQVRGLIGHFVNVLPVRVNVDRGMTFEKHLKHVKDSHLFVHARSGVPFELIVEHMNPPRIIGESPIFQVTIGHQSMANQTISTEDFSLTRMPSPPPNRAKFQLSLEVVEVDNCIELQFVYDAQALDTKSIDGIAADMERMASRFAVSQHALIRDLDTHDATTLAHLLESFGRGRHLKVNKTSDIYERFTLNAEHAPDAPAILNDGLNITFHDLKERSEILAGQLVLAGVGAGSIVCLHLRRSLAFVVAVLAVLKAGGTYVPIDPSQPEKRTLEIVHDCEPALIITSDAVDTFVKASLPPIMRVDSDGATIEIATATLDRRQHRRVAENTVYVMYTSGSTGRPKGVMVNDIGLNNLLDWAVDEYRMTSTDRTVFKSVPTFDISAWEMLLPLVHGSAMVLAADGLQADPAALCTLIEHSQATMVHFVPSMLEVFLDQIHGNRCPTLTHIFCGGEALSVQLRQRCMERFPRAEVHNLYGPTECTVACTFKRGSSPRNGQFEPIGRPIGNTSIYILDRGGYLVPEGTVGEIYVGGEGVADGYLNSEELTRERFLPNPFDAGTKMYRTGDMARWLENGDLEFCGRADYQVKIRGMRVELGEIEEKLCSIPEIKRCVVLQSKKNAEIETLTAYIELRRDQKFDADSIRTQLMSKIPDHMVPAAYAQIEEWPLTTSGKIDRESLLEIPAQRQTSRGYVAPIGDTEVTLASLWRRLLGAEKISRFDNFFDLGGHSLALTKLAYELNDLYKITVSIADLHQRPCLDEMASFIAENTAALIAGSNNMVRFEI
jgi:amino acid adenylation domain-containing protein